MLHRSSFVQAALPACKKNLKYTRNELVLPEGDKVPGAPPARSSTHKPLEHSIGKSRVYNGGLNVR
jgi:hypothetical protein